MTSPATSRTTPTPASENVFGPGGPPIAYRPITTTRARTPATSKRFPRRMRVSSDGGWRRSSGPGECPCGRVGSEDGAIAEVAGQGTNCSGYFLVPLERGRQRLRGEIEVDHATPRRRRRRRRGVQDQRTHGDDRAALGKAVDRLGAGPPRVDRAPREPTDAVRSTQHAYGSVGRPAVIEMHAHGEHALQQLGRCLHVLHAVLLAPWRE